MPTNKIGEMYGDWYGSRPFDIGTTTRVSFRKLNEVPGFPNEGKMMAVETPKSAESVSNGSLMRCTPLAIFTSLIEDDKKRYEVVKNDVEFTHPNPLVHESIFLYCSTIKYLILNHENEDRANGAF